MAKRIVGTPRKFTINGISFDVDAEASISWSATIWENSMLPTSGKGIMKKVKRIPSMESVTLVVSMEEVDMIRVMSDELKEHKFGVVFADGSEAKAEGAIVPEQYESGEGKFTIQVQPSGDWTIIPA
jgi:hypothetical protein